MPDEPSQGPGRAGRVSPLARLSFPGTALHVRSGLTALLSDPLLCGLAEDSRQSLQIVLAEVLNNIVEHAYAADAGEIEITLRLDQGALHCHISDSGAAMPNGRLPPGLFQEPGETRSLPEGGFGWFLIRSLARDLDYRRVSGRNLLSFHLPCEQSQISRGAVSN